MNTFGVCFMGLADCKNCIICDWLTFTVKDMDFDGAVCLLGMSEIAWQNGKGSKLHYEYVKTFEGITIHYTDRLYGQKYNSGVCVEMSGGGCRTYETKGGADFPRLLQWLFEGLNDKITIKQDGECAEKEVNNINITRLDLAFDDFTGVLDLPVIEYFADNCFLTTEFSEIHIEKSMKCIDVSKKGVSVCFGSRSSPVFLRIYDKRAERNAFDEFPHWVRCEIQMRSSAARGFIKNFCENVGTASFSLGRVFAGIVANYLLFRCPGKSDTNKSRWYPCPWWRRFLGSLEPLSTIEKKTTDYNRDRMERYAYQQNHNHTKTLIEMDGLGEYLRALHQHQEPIPDKYKIVATAEENSSEILRRLDLLSVESSEDYLKRCRDDIQKTLDLIENQRAEAAAAEAAAAARRDFPLL